MGILLLLQYRTHSLNIIGAVRVMESRRGKCNITALFNLRDFCILLVYIFCLYIIYIDITIQKVLSIYLEWLYICLKYS